MDEWNKQTPYDYGTSFFLYDFFYFAPFELFLNQKNFKILGNFMMVGKKQLKHSCRL
jgi:hypothetical protein